MRHVGVLCMLRVVSGARECLPMQWLRRAVPGIQSCQRPHSTSSKGRLIRYLSMASTPGGTWSALQARVEDPPARCYSRSCTSLTLRNLA